MFEDGGVHQKDVSEWEQLEKKMVELYNDPDRQQTNQLDEGMDFEEDELELRIEHTGSLLTLHSSVSHLAHFCAVIPNASNATYAPIYDVDPPELPEGWHSLQNRSASDLLPYKGPFGSTVTLPKVLPPALRVFSTERIYASKISAHRHAAFNAYSALYNAGLLNDSLLPLTSVIEPKLEDDVQALLKEVERRQGTAGVAGQMDPWAPSTDQGTWYSYELVIGTFPKLHLLTQTDLSEVRQEDGPTLYRPGRSPAKVALRPLGLSNLGENDMQKAREFTRQLFWGGYGSKMSWDDLDFAYLIRPRDRKSVV